MNKVEVKAKREFYELKEEFNSQIVEELIKEVAEKLPFVCIQKVDATEKDSSFIDITVYISGVSSPMPRHEAEYTVHLVTRLGFNKSQLRTIQYKMGGRCVDFIKKI